MNKKFITAFALLTTVFGLAQQNTSSSYSFFGIGETRFRGTPEQKAMGGLGILPDSVHVNLSNPAAYSSLKLTTINVAGVLNQMDQVTSSELSKTKRVSVDYITIGIPMGKFGATLGLNPNTAVGYRIQDLDPDKTRLNNYTGEGGSNRFFVGAAYQITPKLSFGFDANFYFGQTKTTSKIYAAQAQFGTLTHNTNHINGFNTNLGLMYNTNIGKKHQLYTSLTYAPGYNLKMERNTLMSTLGVSSTGNEYLDETYDLGTTNFDVKMPSKLTVGFGIGKARKWLVGTELAYSQKNNFTHPISQGYSSFSNTTPMRVSLGGYYIPKYNSYSSYFDRITYRAGVKYENTGLNINGQDIKDFGGTLGFNLPIGNGFSDLSFAFEYGKRGTTSANLIKEEYFNLTIGLSITDKWFRKYLFD